MTNIVKKINWDRHIITLETGEIARQADGAIFISMENRDKPGKTQLLVTVVEKKDTNNVNNFLPLTVNYQERSYASGKIPGGFNKRGKGAVLVNMKY